MFRAMLLLVTLGFAASGAWAAAPSQTGAAGLAEVTLDVEGMTCGMCPITVRKALEQVPGVIEARASYEDERGWATVRFDPSRTTVEALLDATREAGYPSKVRLPPGDAPDEVSPAAGEEVLP